MRELFSRYVGPVIDDVLCVTRNRFLSLLTMAEMLAGLELFHYLTPNLQHDLFYWQRQAKNATAEVDYVLPAATHILPFEVKAGVQGGMKSLWDYMRERKLSQTIRCSLENFGEFDYTDSQADGAVRHVRIFPQYAIRGIS